MIRGRKFALFAAGAASALCLVLLVHAALAVPKRYSPYRKLNIFTRVLGYIENNYVEHVDDKKLIYGAIKGMMDTLDPHSTFMSPEIYKQMKVETTGEFGGIGIEVEIRNSWLTIVTPLDGTPAQRAGLRPGDQIRVLNGKSTRGMRMHQAVRAMRGARGTRMGLGIKRKGHKKLLRFQVVRDVIQIISVTYRELEQGIGYLRIKNFSDRTHMGVKKALDLMARKRKLKGLILDLRNNPGGLLDQAVLVADVFVSGGTIVRTAGHRGKVLDVERAHSRGTLTGFPMICLVNGGSASASEIVAGALQDHKRAVIMGTRSFGKGSVQTIIDLEDGSGLKLTVARYYTPSGRSIQEHGITPDIVVHHRPPPAKQEKVKREKDLQRHLTNETQKAKPAPVKRLKDFQLQTALDYLKAADIFGRQAGRNRSRVR